MRVFFSCCIVLVHWRLSFFSLACLLPLPCVLNLLPCVFLPFQRVCTFLFPCSRVIVFSGFQFQRTGLWLFSTMPDVSCFVALRYRVSVCVCVCVCVCHYASIRLGTAALSPYGIHSSSLVGTIGWTTIRRQSVRQYGLRISHASLRICGRRFSGTDSGSTAAYISSTTDITVFHSLDWVGYSSRVGCV